MVEIRKMNPYTALGLKHDASPVQIKRAFQRLAMRHHPDRGGQVERFKQIVEAYESLKNTQSAFMRGIFDEYWNGNIAKEFSKTNRVLYVNRAYDRNTIFKSLFNFFLFRGNQSSLFKTFSLTSAAKNLWVLDTGIVLESINWMSNPFFDFFNKLNGKKIAESIKMTMNQIGFRDTVLFVDNDFVRAQYLPDLLEVKCFIYYT